MSCRGDGCLALPGPRSRPCQAVEREPGPLAGFVVLEHVVRQAGEGSPGKGHVLAELSVGCGHRVLLILSGASC
jgi:hypothetical protein